MNAGPIEGRPFLFDVDFDNPENRPDDPPEVEEEPPPPTFSEAELQAAKQEGYNIGHAAGHKESNAGFEHRIAESLDVATTTFSRLATAQELANQKIALDGLRLAAALVEKMMPEMVRRHGAEEIESAVTDVLQNIIDIPAVTVTVHNELTDLMSERLRTIADKSGIGDQLVVTGDPTMGLSDCRVAWGDGGAERNADAIWSKAKDTLDRNLAPNSDDATVTPAMESPDEEVAAPPIDPTNEAAATPTELTPDLTPNTPPDNSTAPLDPPVNSSSEAPEPQPPSSAEPGLGIEQNDVNSESMPNIISDSGLPGNGDLGAMTPPTPDVTDMAASETLVYEAPEIQGSIETGLPDLPDAVEPDLPGAVAPDLPGAVAPGLPGAVQPAETTSETNGEPA
jgi:flagellar assembly protein FliH